MKNIKKVLPFLAIMSFFMLSFLFSPLVPSAQAATAVECKPATGLQVPAECQNYKCDINKTGTEACIKANPITQWIVFFINILGVLIVVGASAMLVFAGVEYIAAADNPDRVKSAKQKITNVIIGVLAFFFLYAFMQWLIPGGAF